MTYIDKMYLTKKPLVCSYTRKGNPKIYRGNNGTGNITINTTYTTQEIILEENQLVRLNSINIAPLQSVIYIDEVPINMQSTTVNFNIVNDESSYKTVFHETFDEMFEAIPDHVAAVLYGQKTS